MSHTSAAVLEPVGEGQIALESIDIQARLRGLFSEVAVTQAYRNAEDVNIEAVYTFPLPLDAVLLDLSLELNGRTLRGVVQARSKAEAQYEEAIEEGDSAILLQRAGDGLFTLNVGNLLPGERAVVRFRYAQLHHWQGSSLRFHLPTTIAPRYGDPAAAGLAPHQVPEYSLNADHGFSLTLRIEGALANADLTCPSHPIALATDGDARIIRLAGGSALLDRDFVLVLEEPRTGASEGLWAADGDDYVALASFHPVMPETGARPPRHLQLLVDCSGSMGGDSIAQARVALHEILSLLESHDRFNLIAFGSTFELLFPEPVMANEENLQKAVRYLERLDANMGGTEIGLALDAALHNGRVEAPRADLLLITDGMVWGHEPIIERARASGHRVFSVGVGSAVSESFVRGIAEATGGHAELVSPREDMAERIVRHFRRIDQPRARSARVEWPVESIRQTPTRLEPVFAGDTLHVFGWFRKRPIGVARLSLVLEDGREVSQQARLCDIASQDDALAHDLPRMGAHARLAELDPTAVEAADWTPAAIVKRAEQKLAATMAKRLARRIAARDAKNRLSPRAREAQAPLDANDSADVATKQPADNSIEATALAERYQLVTKHTSCVLVYDRETENKPGEIPALRKVPQALAAGWGGMGTVGRAYEEGIYVADLICYEASEKASPTDSALASLRDFFQQVVEEASPTDSDRVSSSRSASISPPDAFSATLDRLLAALNARYPDTIAARLDLSTIDELIDLGLDDTLAEALRAWVKEGHPERSVVIAFLAELARSAHGAGLSRHVRRLIRSAERSDRPSADLEKSIGQIFS